MKLDLTGQHILVTGASRGIGRALARALAGAGAQVALHCHRHRDEAETLAAELGRGARVFPADLADLDACERLFDDVVAAYGRLHTLVNNAGIALETPLDAPTADWAAAWHRTMAINLRAAELLCRRALQHFRTHGGGRIINVASRAAFRGDTPEYMTYAASKGGLVALTRSIARGFGKDNVCAFTLAPGFVRTDMARDFIDTYGERHVLADLALDRLTEPEDLAPFVVLLASGLADHATGCTIDINAGSYVH
ncbi:SDR family oxidoreductase [Rhodocaloribacter litoris]|uniref:SDR family NAD(P)-dependent oxidoreductase n=1 Tax=Rhodocaloribacter litoris TaxID=2558931 RepID=UPI001423D5FC|nr:SDR family oxidoreductase [Rhodocaloribacter litoris]QXD14527.1 SDR family oxidoreductase [Rhodocaloribacter litoris]